MLLCMNLGLIKGIVDFRHSVVTVISWSLAAIPLAFRPITRVMCLVKFVPNSLANLEIHRCLHEAVYNSRRYFVTEKLINRITIGNGQSKTQRYN